MTFTTACFVRVKDNDKRHQLIEFLDMISRSWYSEGETLFVGLTGHQMARLALDGVYPRHAIDCGTDVELFKALAAMNQENDRQQWFTDGHRWELCPSKKADISAWVHRYNAIPHKASAEEIIEHFKTQKS